MATHNNRSTVTIPSAKLTEIGILIVIVLQGRNLPDKHKFSKQDPFVVCALNNSPEQKTKVDNGGGQHPTWDEELRFIVMSAGGKSKNVLKLSVYAKELGEDDLLGIGEVEIDGKWPKNEFDDWVSISINGKPKGEIFLEMTFYPVEPPLVKPAPNVPPKVQLNLSSHLARRPSRYTPAERLARPSFNSYPHPFPTTPISEYSNRPSLPTHSTSSFQHPHSGNSQVGTPSRIQSHQQYPYQPVTAIPHQSHLPFPGEQEPEIPLSLRVGRLSLEGTSSPPPLIHQPLQHQPEHQQYWPQQQQAPQYLNTRVDPRLNQGSHSPIQVLSDPNYQSYIPPYSSPYPPIPYYSQSNLQQSQTYQYPPQSSGPSPPPILQQSNRPLHSPPLAVPALVSPSLSTSPYPQYPQQQQQQYTIPHQAFLSTSPPPPTSSPYRPPSQQQQQQSYIPPVPPRPTSSNSNDYALDTRYAAQLPPPRPPKTPILPPKLPLSNSSSSSVERPILPPPVHHSSDSHITSSTVPSYTYSTSSSTPPRVTSLPLSTTSSPSFNSIPTNLRPSHSTSPSPSIIHAGQASLALRIQQERSDALYASSLANSLAEAERESELLLKKREAEREKIDWKVAEELRIQEERLEKEEREKRLRRVEDDERLARELAES